MPKRKIDEVESDGGEEHSGESAGSEDSNSSVNTSSSADVPSAETTVSTTAGLSRTHQRKRVKFQGVTVYYFQRKQGFVCVPSQGGSTLGMCDSHAVADNFSIKEFARHQRQLHLEILAQQRGTKFATALKELQRKRNAEQSMGSSPSSSNAEESESSSSEEEEDDLNVDDYYFLQPVPTRQRRLMLRQAGIKKIDTQEKEECKDIRTSRESCGCDCRVYCEPETCACSLAGIKCQVDRLSFPCGCSKEGCGNHTGRIEFNPIRVRTHFIHTLMRLEMDKKKEEEQAMRELRLKENGPVMAEASPVCPELVTDPDPPTTTSAQINTDEDDISQYNSNERGSCCDCQNSDIHEFMMHESQFNGATANSVPGRPNGGVAPQQSPAASTSDYLSNDTSSTVEVANSNGHSSKGGENLPNVLLFNDSDDDYSAEGSVTMYPFSKEDSSYSESSDCSSEASVCDPEQNPTAGANLYQGFSVTDASSYSAGSTSGLDNTQAANFCMQPSILQQDSSKFLADLSEPGSSYKLEPISEILNPVRFSAYGSPCAATSWCTENFPDVNSQVTANSPFCDADLAKGQGYMYSVDADGNSSTSTDSLGPIISPNTTMPEQYLEQSYPEVTPTKTALSPKPLELDSTQQQQQLQQQQQEDNVSDQSEEEETDAVDEHESMKTDDKSHHDLGMAKERSLSSISILPLPSPQKVNQAKEMLPRTPTSLTVLKMDFDKLEEADLTESVSTSSTTVGAKPEVAEADSASADTTPTYRELPQLSGVLTTTSGYSLPQRPTAHITVDSDIHNVSAHNNSAHDSPSLDSASLNGAKSEIDSAKTSAATCTDSSEMCADSAESSADSAEMSTDSAETSADSAETSADSSVSSMEDNSSVSQNFGEMIKESMVEIVSA